MNTPLAGMKIAAMAANGFQEDHLITMQKMLRDQGASVKIISTDSGLISGMSQGNWGHSHAVDEQLNVALGVDYSAVIVLGGESSHAKFKKTAHTKRFIGSFQTSQKPVIVLGDAIALLDATGQMNDSVMAIDEMTDENKAAMIAFLMNNNDMDVAA
ncbi:MAG: DJ-1/PfpI family protein [Pseudomonadota bacterium]